MVMKEKLISKTQSISHYLGRHHSGLPSVLRPGLKSSQLLSPVFAPYWASVSFFPLLPSCPSLLSLFPFMAENVITGFRALFLIVSCS